MSPVSFGIIALNVTGVILICGQLTLQLKKWEN